MAPGVPYEGTPLHDTVTVSRTALPVCTRNLRRIRNEPLAVPLDDGRKLVAHAASIP